MLPRNPRQEALSRAYVRAVAAQAGVLCSAHEQDFGIDMSLRAVEVRGREYWDTGPQFDLQVKSTTQALIRDTSIVHDLEVRAYNILRETVMRRPRILVLLVLPEDENLWLSQSPDELIVRRCAYWTSLRGAEPTTSHTTVRISIPAENLFSVEAIRAIMERLGKGAMP
jgi:hypothetical protein